MEWSERARRVSLVLQALSEYLESGASEASSFRVLHSRSPLMDIDTALCTTAHKL